MRKIIIDGNSLTLDDLVKVSRYNYPIEIEKEALKRVKRSGQIVEDIFDMDKISCELGSHLSEEIVRAMMLLKINILSKAYSDIRFEILEVLVKMINRGIHPIISEKGYPTNMALTMLGAGEVIYKGKRVESKEAMDKAGIKPLEYLSTEEGQFLINDAQCMMAIEAIKLYDAINLMKTADISLSLTMEALSEVTCTMDEGISLVKSNKGQFNTVKNILNILEGSEMITNQDEHKTQDYYFLRSSPQIHGSSKDTLEDVKDKLEIAMNVETESPIIFQEEGKVCNVDFLGDVLSDIGDIASKRLEEMVNQSLGQRLPELLVNDEGSKEVISARKVIAKELLASVQAIDLRGKKKLGLGTQAAYGIIRDHVPFINEERVVYEDINICEEIIKDNLLVEVVEETIEQELSLFDEV